MIGGAGELFLMRVQWLRLTRARPLLFLREEWRLRIYPDMKRYFHLAIGSCLLLLAVLFTGRYEDDEFGEKSFFIKYRPTFKFYFYSPTGMSDTRVADLPPALQDEEKAFREFVVRTGVQYPGTRLVLLVPVLIQSALTFLLFGSFAFLGRRSRWYSMAIHFVLNAVITAVGLGATWQFPGCTVPIMLSILLISTTTAFLFSFTTKATHAAG
jgi:hypothetical protein